VSRSRRKENSAATARRSTSPRSERVGRSLPDNAKTLPRIRCGFRAWMCNRGAGTRATARISVHRGVRDHRGHAHCTAFQRGRNAERSNSRSRTRAPLRCRFRRSAAGVDRTHRERVHRGAKGAAPGPGPGHLRSARPEATRDEPRTREPKRLARRSAPTTRAARFPESRSARSADSLTGTPLVRSQRDIKSRPIAEIWISSVPA